MNVKIKDNYLYINGEVIKRVTSNSFTHQILDYMIEQDFKFATLKLFEDLYDLESDSIIYTTIHQINKKTEELFGEKFILNSKKGLYYPNPWFNTQKETIYKVKIPKSIKEEFLKKYNQYIIKININ